MNIAKRIQTWTLKINSLLVICLLRFLGARIGAGVLIFRNCRVYNAQNLNIGSNVFINDNFWCNAKGGVSIFEDVLIGPNVVIHSSNHNFEDRSDLISSQGHTDLPVIIRRDVWLAAGCIILPGADIPEGCVIAAGAVVTGPLEKSGVYAGVPARWVRARGDVRTGA